MARIALGSNVKEGPRRGQVVGHRPQGMVDVQFEDAGWVERRQEKKLRKGNPAPDTYDPTLEQWRRQVLGIYKTQVKRGFTPEQAKKDAFRIAGGVTYRDGRRKKGKMEATAKGRRGAKAKLESPDAWKKRQEWELFLATGRKSGKHRVVPQKHGKQTRYYVQPGGRYFYGTGAKKRAMALRDELNGAKMKGRKRKAANPGYPVRENWLPAAAAVLTIADVGYRAVKDKTKRKDTENPRYLDERDGMTRGVYGLHSAARDALQQAAILGRLKGLRELEYSRVQGNKQKHWDLRRAAQNRIDAVEREFDTLAIQVANEIPSRDTGLRSEAQSKAMGALRRAYSGAYHNTLDAQEEKRRRRKKVSNPRDIPTGWAESATGRPAFASKRTKGIAARGVGDPWADVRSPKAFQGMKPTLYRDGETFYLVYEGKSSKIPRVISAANRASGLKGPKWRREKSVTSDLWKDVAETPTRYAIRHPKSGRGSKSDPYKIYDKVKKKYLGKTFTLRKKADEELWRLQGGTRRDYSPQARGLEDRPRIEQVRSDRQAGEQITAYRTTSVDRAKYVADNLSFLDWGPTVFKRPTAPKKKSTTPRKERPTRRGRKRDLQDRLDELEALEAQLMALKAKANPMRSNGLAAIGRGALAGGKWLIKSKVGKAILAEAAVIGTMMVGEKLMSQGKVSPKVMKYIQARVEKETGRKPTQAEVRKVLHEVDPNKDQTLTADEVSQVLKRKTKKRSRR